MAGTIAYMAPEQIAGHPQAASDQYALGIIAYEWLCGTRPFHGSFTEIAIQHSVTPPISLREHLPTISLDIEHVVLIALAKRPEDRFASVRAFANAFGQAYQSNIPAEQRKPMTPLSSPFFPSLPKNPDPSDILTTPVVSAVPTVQIAPNLPTPEKMTGKPSISRRVVLIGVVGGVVIAAAGTSVFVISRTQLPQTHLQQQSQPTRQPTMGQLLSTYKGHTDAVAMAVWSPDGQRIVSSSSDKTVQVWNAINGRNVFTYLGHASATRAVAWSLNGKLIASGSEDKTVQVWNASDGSNVFTYPGHTDKVWGVTWSPNGQRIASCSDDKTVQVWNANDGGNVFTYRGHTNPVYAVAWSPDGQLIASGSLDKTVQVWNANDGSNVFTYRGHLNAVRALAWSPNGQLIASGSWDGTVQVWNASDGSNAFTYRGHTNQVKTVAWSPDGQLIVSGAADKTARVWSASSGSEVFIYKGHSNTVSTVAWSPGGRRIASGSLDKTMQVWYVG